jgi:transcription elongation factor GreA
MLLSAVIIEENQGPKDQVDLGCRVTVTEDGMDEPEVFVIVGAAEADPSSGRISNESPIGNALMERKVGDRVVIQVPAGEILFEIQAID